MANCSPKCNPDDHFEWSDSAKATLLDLLENDKVRMSKLGIHSKRSLGKKILDHPKYGCPLAYQVKKKQDAPPTLKLEGGGAKLQILVLFYYDPVPTIHWEILCLQ